MAANQTYRAAWTSPRAAIAADDTLVSASAATMKYANIPAYAYRPSPGQNALEIAFTMDANASSCVVYLFGARENGDIVLVWTGTITAGTQQATDGGVWVDTIAGSNSYWPTTLAEIDGGGNNRMFRLALDTAGYKHFFTQFTGLAAETVKTFYSGW